MELKKDIVFSFNLYVICISKSIKVPTYNFQNSKFLLLTIDLPFFTSNFFYLTWILLQLIDCLTA